MNNFFYNNSEYSLFKKALRATKGEPVVINISSKDASLSDENSKQEEQVERKVMSQKFEPSPFGKFFGPRKARTAPVDMNDYSSWKNKNYRQAEQNINSHPEEEVKFSLSDYMNKSFGENKFNEEDQEKHDNQKPIDQLSSDDPLYKKFSLDSYLSKLEEQTQVQTDYEKNDDLLEPLKGVAQDFNTDSSQDEEFNETSDIDVEQVALDDHLSGGEKYSFDKSELDKVRNRIEKAEKEANNIKDKPTEKVINSNELTEKLDLEKLGVPDEEKIGEDDIEKVNQKAKSDNLIISEDDENDENKQTPKVSHKKFMEINKNTDTIAPKQKNAESSKLGDDAFDEEEGFAKLLGEEDEGDSDEISESSEENDQENESVESDGEGRKEFISKSKPDINNVLTKDDLKSFGDEIMQKFTKLYTENNAKTQKEETQDQSEVEQYPYDQNMEVGLQDASYNGAAQMQPAEQPYYQAQEYGANANEYLDKQAELQAKLLEMIESNKKSDQEAQEKLKQIELEKAKITESYEERLKELEQNFKKRDEELKQKAYLDKLRSDIKLKKAESNYKLREERIKEFEKSSSERQKFGEILKKELKNNLNVSNLEMDKKLLEVASKIKKEEQNEDKIIKVNVVQEPTEEKEKEKPKVKASAKPRRKATRNSHSHTRSPRRKIDSDIIGGINFD